MSLRVTRSCGPLQGRNAVTAAPFLLWALWGLGCAGAIGAPDPKAATEGIYLTDRAYERLAPPVAYEHQIRGELLASRGNFEAAARAYEAACDADPGDFYLHVRLSEILVEQGEYEKARPHLNRVLRDDPSNEFAWLVLAKLHYGQGRVNEATEAAQLAMKMEPRRFEAALWLANLFHLKGDLGRSAEILRRIVEASGAPAEAYLALGRIREGRGDWQGALCHYRLFLESSPHMSHSVEKMAAEQIKTGALKRAADLLGIVVKAEPSNHRARKELISALVNLGLSGPAACQLSTLPLPRPGDLEEVLGRADWLARTGQPYAARSVIITYLGAAPDDPKARLALAEIEAKLLRLEATRLLIEDPDIRWTEEQHQRAGEIKKRLTD